MCCLVSFFGGFLDAIYFIVPIKKIFGSRQLNESISKFTFNTIHCYYNYNTIFTVSTHILYRTPYHSIPIATPPLRVKLFQIVRSVYLS